MEDAETRRAEEKTTADRGAVAGELLTIDEVAALLKVPKSWIYERTRRKKIPHIKLGKYLRFQADVLARWLGAGAGRGALGSQEPAVPASTTRRGTGRPLRTRRNHP